MAGERSAPPTIVAESGTAAAFAYAEFVGAEIESAHTYRAYQHAIDLPSLTETVGVSTGISMNLAHAASARAGSRDRRLIVYSSSVIALTSSALLSGTARRVAKTRAMNASSSSGD